MIPLVVASERGEAQTISMLKRMSVVLAGFRYICVLSSYGRATNVLVSRTPRITATRAGDSPVCENQQSSRVYIPKYCDAGETS
jgi:hypothetical protein